jgi:hypothetical protein
VVKVSRREARSVCAASSSDGAMPCTTPRTDHEGDRREGEELRQPHPNRP